MSEESDQVDEESFFSKVKKNAAKIPFVEDAVSAYFALIDPKTPVLVKAPLAAALAYFISPIDAIPDITPVAGFIDDAGVIAAAIAFAGAAIKNRHRKQAHEWLVDEDIDWEDDE